MYDKNGALVVLLWDVAGNPLVLNEDAAHASGDAGIQALGVRKDAAAALAGADGDYAPFEVDANGRLHVAPLVAADGTALFAVPPQLDDTDKVAVSLYGKKSAAGDKAILATTAGRVEALAGKLSSLADNHGFDYGIWAVDTNDSAYPLVTAGLLTNAGGNYDRQRNNLEGTLLASAARTSTVSSADQTNWNGRGVRVTINVSALVDTPSITVAVEEKDPVSGNYVAILTSAAIATTGQKTTLVVYPGNSAVANEKADHPLPRTWRVTVTHADTDSITYSVGYAVIV